MFAARNEIDFSWQRGSVQRAQEDAFYWFTGDGGGELMYPRLKGKARTPNVRKSLFWFREDALLFSREAGSVVMRARELAAAITLAGCEIREIKLNDPGRIIWEDSRQVLALPEQRKIPRAFC
ncbi:hypothetical protein [Ruegeria sp. HKCCD8929]|uniref:hypothetical protein n=1 Tax=Ruegeria sp. HKCCD8929 TaxID=2683006 RepID=UPI00148887CB|nr:hypothetical protein [Ruegeria sp. HKCCD8929]